MKYIYIIWYGLTIFEYGCNNKPKHSSIFTSDTTYQVTTNIRGDTVDITPIVNGKPNGQYRSYYESGQIWNVSSYVDGKIHGISYTFTENGDTAIKQVWKNNTLWEKIIYWQPVPYSNNGKFYFLSNTGIITVKESRYIYDFGENPPDGLVIEKYENEIPTPYVYKNGKLELFSKQRSN